MVGASAWKTEALERLKDEVPPEAFSRVRMLRGISKSDLKRLYMEAALFVLPSLFEGFGIPVV
jgi:glycosyltransferase involved in cell wall biosynthesis